MLLGLASVWNVSFLGYPARAILPYTQALSKLAPHIQQACALLEAGVRSHAGPLEMLGSGMGECDTADFRHATLPPCRARLSGRPGQMRWYAMQRSLPQPPSSVQC